MRVAALLVLLLLSCPRSAEAEETPPHVVYFPQTGHHLAEPFLTFWRSHGGIRIFGYPISETLEREGLLVQYFERTRMEAPLGSNNADCPVQLTRVGALLTADRTDLAFQPFSLNPPPASPLQRYFPETGHTLAHGFLRFWLRNGGLPIFGYPISEELTEINPETHEERIVQYFERARFEWHPEALGTQWEVELARLGAVLAERDGIPIDPVPEPLGSPTTVLISSHALSGSLCSCITISASQLPATASPSGDWNSSSIGCGPMATLRSPSSKHMKRS